MWAQKMFGRKIASLSLKRGHLFGNRFRIIPAINKKKLLTMSCLSIGLLGMARYGTINTNLAQCQGTRITYDHENVHILEHSILPLLISRLRNPECKTREFREVSDRIMQLLVEEAIGHEPKKVTKKTSLAGGEYDHYELEHSIDDYCAITIIRAGDSMLHKVFDLMPGISVGKVLVQRDEESEDKHPIFYYSKLPKGIAEKKRIFILDPMLGTGGSCKCVVSKLLEAGVQEKNITFINLISCPEGLNALTTAHPSMKIITAVLDPEMNDNRYITPGLGDFGDRYFNSY